ncbi:MAG: hypothetical protein FH762_16840 [Firmicutes bacterium]|nr:hypothetical protein [Bacillota bacterium]
MIRNAKNNGNCQKQRTGTLLCLQVVTFLWETPLENIDTFIKARLPVKFKLSSGRYFLVKA